MATLKLILGVAVIGALVLAGIKIVPPFFSNYEFEDAIKTEAVQSTYSTRSEDDIREAVIKQARSYDLNIEADYSVPIDLPGYSTTLEFHPSTKNKGVY